MNAVFVGHVAAFSLAALACFLGAVRARAVRHPETRTGLTAVLVASGIWAGGYVGYLLVPMASFKMGFYVLGQIFALVAVGAWLYFSAAYTGRPPRQAPYRRFAVGAFLLVVLSKVTNPLHELYFTAEWSTEPFVHLAIHRGIVFWLVLGSAYAVVAVSFFMLLERFYHAGTDTRPLVALVGVTALPIGLNVLGATGPWFLPMLYEPIGVAIFAVGIVFVYLRRFQAVQFAGVTDDPAVFLDRDGRVRDYNRAAGDILPELDGSIGEDIESVSPRIAEVLDDGDSVVELERNGETRYYRISTSPFVAGEVLTGRLVSISDVTDLEQYRRELERKTEQLEALNRVVRHDIRNDMTVVLGWAETLREHVDEDGKAALERIIQKSNHVVELTEVARDFVDSLAGEGEPELKPVDVSRHLEVELEAARESYPGAEFRIDGDLPQVTVLADEMLPSVFRNLLNNAVQHNDEETPEVTVEATERDGRVDIRIADNGPGIPDSRKKTVFGKGESSLEEGGIGLYLVKTLVEQYGGNVRIEDNEPKGAVFVVELQTATPDGG